MVIGPLVNLASGFIQSLFQGSRSSQEANQPSPFAQVLGNLDQSTVTQYQHVAQRIASYLHTGAQSATANGNTALAGQLTQLSTEITNASASGRIPNS
jgi:hypothetical protein